MNKDWTFKYLVPAGGLPRPKIAAVIERLGSSGMRTWDEITLITGDGLGELIFSSPDGAIDWLGANDGLIPLVDGDLEVAISLQRVDGVLASALTDLKVRDTAVYDELHLLMRLESNADWTAFEGAVLDIFGVVGAVYCQGVDDDQFEDAAQHQALHTAISRGQLPDSRPWMTIVPLDDAWEQRLRTLASAVGRPIARHPNALVLRLSDLPRRSFSGGAAESMDHPR